jgi:hypothetical protein
MPLRVLVRLRCQVAQIEVKIMTKRIAWSNLQRRGSKQLKNTAPLATIKMGVVYISYCGPSVIAVRVLVQLRQLVAQIEEKIMMKRFI